MADLITSSITTKGQITVPKEIRRRWKVRPGRDRVAFRLSPSGRVEVVPIEVKEKAWTFTKEEWAKIAKLRKEKGKVFPSAAVARKFLDSL